MKLKGKPRETLEITLAEGEVDGEPYKVTATVAHLSRKDLKEVYEQSVGLRWDPEAPSPSGRRGEKGAGVPDFDLGKNLRETLRRQVPAVSGLTPAALLALGDVPPHVELEVEVGADGFVVWDHDRIAYREETEVPAPVPGRPDRKIPRVTEYTLASYLYAFAPTERFQDVLAEAQASFQRLRDEAEKKSAETSGGSPS